MSNLPINQIICGDCLEVMREWRDGCVDAIVTDPEFGIGFKYGTRKESCSTSEQYKRFLFPYLAECKRIAKPGAFFAVWQAQLYFRHFWDWFGPDIHIYCAGKNFVQLRKTPINYGYDPVVMWYQEGTALRPQKPSRNIDFFVANTARIVSDPTRLERGHPCPRPLDAVLQVVDNFTLPGGLIVDPMCGSGTTCLAAQQLGRKFIGIDISKEYCRIARERLRQDAPLFQEVA